MPDPTVVIVIHGGIVTAVATTGKELSYRIVDMDVRGTSDEKADTTEIDIKEYTEATLKGR